MGYIVTHDGRTIRYPDPLAKLNDVVKVDIETGKAKDVIKFETGAVCDHPWSESGPYWCHHWSREAHWFFRDCARVDAKGRAFATRIANVFVLSAKADEGMVSLPRGKGLRDNILEERKKRLGY